VGGVVGERDRLRERGVSPLAVLGDGVSIVDAACHLEAAAGVVIHQPETVIVEEPEVVPGHALGPLSAWHCDHAYVLARVDVGNVGGELVADVVGQGLLEHVHARELTAGGDVVTQGGLPGARRGVESLAAQERRKVLLFEYMLTLCEEIP
jgi:hypothetical protein